MWTKFKQSLTAFQEKGMKLNWMSNQEQQQWDIATFGCRIPPITETEMLNGLQTFWGWWCVSFDLSTMQMLEWLDVAIKTAPGEQNLVEGSH